MRFSNHHFFLLSFLMLAFSPTLLKAQNDCMSNMNFSITQSKSEPSEVYVNVLLPVIDAKLGVKDAKIRTTNDSEVPYILSVYLKNKLFSNNHGVLFSQVSAEGQVSLDPKKSMEVIIYFPDDDAGVQRKKKALTAHAQFD